MPPLSSSCLRVRGSAQRGGYLKFPPTIGSTGSATVLFIGINAYRVERNQRLYSDAMASLESFATLAGNHEPHSGSAASPRYIRRSSDSGPSPYGHEAFYNQYMDIVEGVWGTGTPFEAHAAATELYLCSTPETRGRPFTSHSECADNFFATTFAQVEPKAVITVGRAPREYMRREYATSPVTSNTPSPYRARVGERATWVFDIPHNGARASRDSRIRAIRHAIDGLCDMVHHGRDPRQVPLAELLVNGSSQQAADSLKVDEARRRLAAGEPYSDGRVYPPYRPEARKPRLHYGAYLAAWAIRQALGYNQRDVGIRTERFGNGYGFSITPRRPQ